MKMADMKRIIISIVLGVWALVSYSQVVEENPPSQTLSSLMDEQSKKEVKRSVKSFVLSVGPAWNVSKVYTSQVPRWTISFFFMSIAIKPPLNQRGCLRDFDC